MFESYHFCNKVAVILLSPLLVDWVYPSQKIEWRKQWYDFYKKKQR